MTKKAARILASAYANAHVCADITEKLCKPEEEQGQHRRRLDWCLETARDLVNDLLKLKNELGSSRSKKRRA